MKSPLPMIVVAGNPNSGKTTLWNALTGARGRVGNYPGVTVDRETAELEVGGVRVELCDLPGTYSLTARSLEEKVAVDALTGRVHRRPDAVVVVVDATVLRRGLYFVSQVLDLGLPTIVCVNMMDDAEKDGSVPDIAKLSARLGCPVLPLAARRGQGVEALETAIGALAKRLGRGEPPHDAPEESPALAHPAVAALAPLVAKAWNLEDDRQARAIAAWAILSLGDDELDDIPEDLRRAVEAEHSRHDDLDAALILRRYAHVDEIMRDVLPTTEPRKRLRDRLDDALLHPVLGLLIFCVVMALVFQSLFSWSEPLIGLVESGVEFLKSSVTSALPEGMFRDLVVNGIVSGVGNVVVFLPQIALLFVFITFLEDSGYLARVAFVIDRLMGGIGLHGRAFVPMLSGFACAIPAVMATRTIESRRDRLLTMLVVPLTSCSARLPVYVLVVAVVFDPEQKVLGVWSLGAAVLFSMYAGSLIAAVLAAFVLRRTILRGPRPPLVLELPPYRWPKPANVLLATWHRVRRFLLDAGTVILALTIVLWALLNFPKSDADRTAFEARRAAATETVDADARSAALEEIAREETGLALRHSAAGRAGVFLEPVLLPLGFDYRIGIGILGAFAAREVFVSTLGVVFDVGDDATEESDTLREALKDARRPDGSPLFTPLVGIALMIFFVLACQCMSTIAVVRRESGSWKYPLFMFVYMSALAYIVTLLVYQGGRFLGFT